MGLIGQLLAGGLVMGAIYAMVAAGFAIIYGTTTDFHVAHGAIFTLAGYVGHVFVQSLGLSFWPSLIVTTVITAIASVMVQELLYEPLRKAGVSQLGLFAASLGTLIVVENVLNLLFGGSPMPYSLPTLTRPVILGSAVVITPLRVLTVAAAAVSIAAMLAFLKWAPMGREIRAVADRPDMARIVGINHRVVFIAVYALGGALAAPAGFLLAADVGAVPYRGSLFVILGIIATILGGIGSIPGAAVAGTALGILQSLAIWRLPSEWQNAVVFTLFLAVIILRPTGLFGSKLPQSGV